MENQKEVEVIEADVNDPAYVAGFLRNVSYVARLTLADINELSGGGANTLAVAYALGVYEELQSARAEAADPETAAPYREMQKKIRADVEASLATMPPLTPEVVRKAKEMGAVNYDQAREALAAEQARLADSEATKMLWAIWDFIIDAAIRVLCFCLPWRHRVVPAPEDPDRQLLRQFALVRMGRWGALYLQHFVTPEAFDFAHLHRWLRMRSWVLSGFFIEERPLDREHVARRRFTSYTMDRSTIHRVAFWGPRCWTLFWMSPETTDAWGWFAIKDRKAPKRHHILGNFTPWRDYIKRRIESLESGKKEITP